MYKYKRTVFDFPWRYIVYKDCEAVAMTITKWGAKRVIRRAKAADRENQ